MTAQPQKTKIYTSLGVIRSRTDLMYKLIIQDDEGKTTVVPLIREELTIGRQEGNTIRLTERNVSRKHAKLLRGTEEIIIEDLDSYNGVRVNGSRIQGRAELKEADRVQIGDYLIEVKADQPNADAETREIAVIAEPDSPAPIAVSTSDAATVPTSVPVSTPPPPPSPAQAPAVKANGTGPNIAASIVTPDEHASGRLVILSKTMAGREFVLDKPAMVIGRTEENDIWVNHRSISRHHAKVVRENGSYAIVDLQSANGVRVNGEEYGKVELRTRDVVDLGHVRFRFVAPNEDFLFGRDAQPVDIATEGQSGKMLWAAAGLILIGVIAFFMLGGDKDKDKDVKGTATDTPTEPGIDDPPRIDDPPLVPAVVFDASPTGSTDSDHAADIATLIEQAELAKEQENWKTLASAAAKILKIDGANARGQAFAKQATLEAEAEKHFRTFEKSKGKGNNIKAASAFAKIPTDSIYHSMAVEPHTTMRDAFAGLQLGKAKRESKSGRKCEAEISKLIRNTPPEWVEIVTGLKAQKAKCKDGRPVTNPNNGTDKPPPPNPPQPQISTLELLEQAEKAVRSTQFGKGDKLCRQVLEREPGNQRALTACAIAACNLRRTKTAKKYIGRVKSSQRRQGLNQICTRLGLSGF